MAQQFIWKWSTIAAFATMGAWMRLPHAIQILLMLMGLDILTGLIAAGRSKTLNSSIMVKGLFQKLAVFPLLAMLHIVESPLKLAFEFETLAACAFILYEAMSITENAARAGVPIPTVIVNALVKAKIQTSSADDIKRQFGPSGPVDETKLTVSNSTAIVKTPDSQPDLKVDKTATLLEETHIEPIVPPKS
ncbi:MAG: phage holin family protein [Acidobacteriota bacterium]|nr:phage holin family protein [Acidobacteriota bacterium]